MCYTFTNLSLGLQTKSFTKKKNAYSLGKECGIVEALLVVCRRFEFRVEANHLSDEGMTLLFDLLTCAVLTGVQPLALTVVDGLWRRRPARARDKRTQGGKYERPA